MCYITATELKNNLGYYLELSNKEDVYVKKNNKVITVLTNSDKHKQSLVHSLRGSFGKVDKNINYDKILKKEIMKKCSY